MYLKDFNLMSKCILRSMYFVASETKSKYNIRFFLFGVREKFFENV